MPQMAPMSWILLFLFFTFMLIVMNILNYYLYFPKFESSEHFSNKQIMKNKNWKW